MSKSPLKKIDMALVAYRYNERGLIEGYDKTTGRVVSMQASVEDIMTEKGPNILIYMDEDGHEIFLEQGLSLDVVAKGKKTPPFSQFLADLVCEYFLEDHNIRQACDRVGISYRTLCTWRRDNTIFAKQLLDTRKDKAELLHDEALEIARDVRGDTPQKKLTVETLKWAAEKADSDVYGAKTKISGDASAPLVFTVETGIRREKDVGFEKEVEEIEDGS